MVYPFWSKNKSLRESLRENRIYTPVYWPNVKEWCNSDTIGYQLADEVVYLPLDQRYGTKDMHTIINLIKYGDSNKV